MNKTIDNNVDANILWSQFKTRLQDSVDKNVPSKMAYKGQSSPWIRNIRCLHKRKQCAFNKAKKSGTDKDWENFRDSRRKVKNATRKEYRNYVKNQCLNTTKEFWSFMKSLKKDASGIPALKDTHKGELVTDNRSGSTYGPNRHRPPLLTDKSCKFSLF